MGLGADISGPTGESFFLMTHTSRGLLTTAAVWSMPGGFTSSGREGYQVVDDDPRTAVPRGPPPPQKTTIVAPIPQPAPGVQPGNYQNA